MIKLNIKFIAKKIWWKSFYCLMENWFVTTSNLFFTSNLNLFESNVSVLREIKSVKTLLSFRIFFFLQLILLSRQWTVSFNLKNFQCFCVLLKIFLKFFNILNWLKRWKFFVQPRTERNIFIHRSSQNDTW